MSDDYKMPRERLASQHLDTIRGATIELIPYEKQHVPLFHGWLEDPEIQRLVATPAVSLEADYLFQEETSHATDRIIKLIQLCSSDEIIGDVDVFLTPEGEAEINILIASPDQRRRGFASEALTLMMQYAIQKCDIQKFVAKIGENNISSIKFFERQGFQRINSEPNVFHEFIYELDAGDVPSSNLNIISPFNICV